MPAKTDPIAIRRYTLLGIIGTIALTVSMTMGMDGAQAAGHAQEATPKDGELPLPAHYRRWPRFMQHMNKTETGHVRDLYINCIGASSIKGEPMANGSQFVSELYDAKRDTDGRLIKDADGNLIKGDLVHIFMMAKDEGWGAGAGVPESLATGDWIYTAFNPEDGSRLTDLNYNDCRSCHLPLKDDDYIFHYDQYFR